MSAGTLKLGGIYRFDLLTSDNTGAAANADSLPTAAVWEDGDAASMHTATVAQRGSITGHHVVTVDTGAAGFEADKSYNVKGSATVGGIAAHGPIASFVLTTKNVDDDVTTDGASRTASQANVSALALETTVAAVGVVAAATLADTDAIDARLPTDPADQSAVEAAIDASEAAIRGSDSDTLKTISDQLDAQATSVAAVADAVWTSTANGRTLTMTAAEIAAMLEGSAINIQRGDTMVVTITGLGSIADRTKLWWTYKRRTKDTDAQSRAQIEEGGGLLYLNGASTTAGWGSIAVDDEDAGDITITLAADASQELRDDAGEYDVQVLRSDGSINTLTQARAVVNGDVTRAVD